MNHGFDEAIAVMSAADRLYSMDQVDAACDRMAAQINQDFSGRELVVLCIMNGGLVTTGLLLPRLNMPLLVDYLHATRYRDGTIGADLHWRVEPSNELRQRHVLVVDDILDEGYTLDSIIAFCRTQGAASVSAAVLVQKEHDRGVRPPVAYVGMQVPDRYVFGAGMDYKGYWRNAAGIYAVASE